jgi:hypothetical protein
MARGLDRNVGVLKGCLPLRSPSQPRSRTRDENENEDENEDENQKSSFVLERGTVLRDEDKKEDEENDADENTANRQRSLLVHGRRTDRGRGTRTRTRMKKTIDKTKVQ